MVLCYCFLFFVVLFYLFCVLPLDARETCFPDFSKLAVWSVYQRSLVGFVHSSGTQNHGKTKVFIQKDNRFFVFLGLPQEGF